MLTRTGSQKTRFELQKTESGCTQAATGTLHTSLWRVSIRVGCYTYQMFARTSSQATRCELQKHSQGAWMRRLVVHFIRHRDEYQHVLPVITYHQVFSHTSCQETRFELNRRPNWSATGWIHSTLQSHEVFSCVGC